MRYLTIGLLFVTTAGAELQAASEDAVFSTTSLMGEASALTDGAPIGGGREAFGVFDIVMRYSVEPTAAQAAAFSAAETFWESRVHGYETQAIADAVAATGGLTISASLREIDGRGGILGSAGATRVVSTGNTVGTTPDVENFIVPTAGIMQFDSADLEWLDSQGTLEEVIIHEMAHVMGFSSYFWDFVAATDSSGSDLSYTGPFALATYQREFDPDATFIPLEGSGGAGTAYSHWDEVEFADHGANNNPELLTGYLNPEAYVSNTTLAAFDDLGYVTDVTLAVNAVPLPPSAVLLGAGLGGLGLRRHLRTSRV